MDDQIRLLTEIRDLLARSDEHAEAQWADYRADRAKAEEQAKKVEAQYHAWQERLDRYQHSLGATRTALWVIGAVEVAVVAWIISRAGR